MTSPFGRTTSTPRTYCFVTPYFTPAGPPAFSDMIPPIVAPRKLCGSGGKNRPSFASRRVRSWRTTPGSTVAVKFSLSTLTILLNFVITITMPPCQGTDPPLTFVPPPLGVTGIFSALASFIIRDTSSVVVGKTTTSGSWIQLVVPS